MRNVKSYVVSAFGATMIMLSASMPALASGWSAPDSTDITAAVTHVSAEILQITAIPSLDAQNIKVIYIEDILSGDQVTAVKNSLNSITAQANILSLQNVLNLKNVLNGNSILNFGQLLSNNNASLKDVIGVEILNGSQLIVFCCH